MYNIIQVYNFSMQFRHGIRCELSCVSMSMSVSMSLYIKIDIREIYGKHLTFAQCRYMSTEQATFINI